MSTTSINDTKQKILSVLTDNYHLNLFSDQVRNFIALEITNALNGIEKPEATDVIRSTDAPPPSDDKEKKVSKLRKPKIVNKKLRPKKPRTSGKKALSKLSKRR